MPTPGNHDHLPPSLLHEPRASSKLGLTPLSFVMLGLGLFLGAWLCYAMKERFLPQYLNRHQTEGVVGCSLNLTRIGVALEAYAQEHGSYPMSQYELVPDYMKSLPNCPNVERMTYRTSLGRQTGSYPGSAPSYFLVECCGKNHDDARLSPNFPAYDSLEGLRLEYVW